MPQDSVLGSFSVPPYTSPLFATAERHQCSIHMYADDTQLYMSFKVEDGENARTRIEVCIEDVRAWMSSNFLKLNDGKTEFLVISKRSVAKKVAHSSIIIGSSVIPAAPKAKNIGCFIDATLNMDSRVN